MNILDGKAVAQSLKDDIRSEVEKIYSETNIRPKLVVIQVGDDPASSTYVRNKERACQYCGIEVETVHKDETTTTEQLLETITEFNLLSECDGILVQLPLPKHIDEQAVLRAIDPDKDVDGFHPTNVAKLWMNDKSAIVPCTPKGIMKLIETTEVDLTGKKAVVIGRSNIVGKPIAKLLMDAGCTVTICHSKTPSEDLELYCNGAYVVVCAVGKADFLKYPSHYGDGGIMIDVGINRGEDGKLHGDIDYNYITDAYDVDYITPVPGGVGPMTIACLMENTLECFRRQTGIC